MTSTTSRSTSRSTVTSPRRRQDQSARGRLAHRLDRPLTAYYLLLGATTLLLVLGLVMVFSSASVRDYRETGSSFATVEKQAIWILLGLPLTWMAARLPPWVFRAFAQLGLVVALVLLLLVAAFGTVVNGNRNWLDFGGPFRIQPAELAKLALVVWGADLFARKHRLLVQWKHLLVPLLPVGLLVVALVLVGGDLGTAVILMAIVAALLYVAGAPLRLFALLGGCSAALVAWLVSTHPEKLSRITSWLDPSSADPLGAGWQGLHGKYALASGGWWGLGLGGSREKWGALPEAHTDFIFAIIGEELGLVGTVAVLALFAALGFAGFRVAARTDDVFVRLAAAGLTAWILVQALVNIGAVLGVLPITGVPLPLISYGGSALLPTMLALGMLLSFARRSPGVAEALAARPGWARRARSVLRRGR